MHMRGKYRLEGTVAILLLVFQVKAKFSRLNLPGSICESGKGKGSRGLVRIIIVHAKVVQAEGEGCA